MPVVAGQLMLVRPSRHDIRVTLRRSSALAACATLSLQESLILPFQLFLEHHTADALAAINEALGGLHVGAVDPGIVGQLTRLGDADIERLTVVGGTRSPTVLEDGATLRRERHQGGA